ncbi:MAG: polysaccharide deacetylase family protein [Salinivirgaceae bacterium]|nr:polysaccharide deacetylase family protein [Salinivirgaceae bacterium]
MSSFVQVFNFHRVSDEHSPAYPPIPTRVFEKVVKFIKRHYKIISQKELLSLDSANSRKPFAVITFDDGFYDFKKCALPILIKHNVPVSLHVVTKVAETGETFWTQKLNKIVEKYALENKTISNEHLSKEYTLRNDEETEQVALQIYKELLPLKNKVEILDNIAKEIDNEYEKTQMLLWNDLKTLPASIVEIGSHTHTHTNLKTIETSEIHNELYTSWNEINKNTQHNPISIAFPNGQYDERVLEEAKIIGYKIMYTCEAKKNIIPASDNIYHRYDIYNKEYWKNYIKLLKYRFL